MLKNKSQQTEDAACALVMRLVRSFVHKKAGMQRRQNECDRAVWDTVLCYVLLHWNWSLWFNFHPIGKAHGSFQANTTKQNSNIITVSVSVVAIMQGILKHIHNTTQTHSRPAHKTMMRSKWWWWWCQYCCCALSHTTSHRNNCKN